MERADHLIDLPKILSDFSQFVKENACLSFLLFIQELARVLRHAAVCEPERYDGDRHVEYRSDDFLKQPKGLVFRD